MYIQPMSVAIEALKGRTLSNQVSLDRWIATEGQSIDVFLAQLPTLTEALRHNEITQRRFFEGLIGNGQPFRTFVTRADQVSALQPYCIERTAARELRISSCQVGDIPQVTAQIGLNDKGELTIEQVSARFIDYETAAFREVEGEVIDGTNISKHQFGEDMLNALLNNFSSPIAR